jgi:hypothetical protein
LNKLLNFTYSAEEKAAAIAEGASRDAPRWRRSRLKCQGASSQYFGVSFNKATNKWLVVYSEGGKQFRVGSFDDELAAARAYDSDVLHRGLNRTLNFTYSAGEKAETERLQAEEEREQARRSCLRRCLGRYLCCCCDAPPAEKEELTPTTAARAISKAAAACGPVRGAAGVTPRRTTSGQLSSTASLQRLEAACKAMEDVKAADPDQDRDSAEDILSAFVEIGGDENTKTIELGRLRRARESCHEIISSYCCNWNFAQLMRWIRCE